MKMEFTQKQKRSLSRATQHIEDIRQALTDKGFKVETRNDQHTEETRKTSADNKQEGECQI